MIFSLLLAATIAIPALPPSEYDDSEVVTNVALPAIDAESRLFSFRLALDATPSNNVSLVFGRDADMDGVLSRAEESLMICWDCGEWKVFDCATGYEAVEQGSPGLRMMEWRLLVTQEFAPRSLEVSAGGIPLFAALCADRPRFLFDAEWDMVKVVCRGLDAPNPHIVCSAGQMPMTIRIR